MPGILHPATTATITTQRGEQPTQYGHARLGLGFGFELCNS